MHGDVDRLGEKGDEVGGRLVKAKVKWVAKLQGYEWLSWRETGG